MRPLLSIICVLAVLASACGDDADPEPAVADPPDSTTTQPPTSTTPATTSTARSTPPTTDPPATDEPTLVGAEAGDANLEEMQRVLEAAGSADDGPFYMVNLIRHRDTAVYADGRETELTGEEADAIYGEFMRDTKLPEIGAEIVYVADVERDLIGGTSFDRVAVVHYPSRAAFALMAQDPEFQEMSVHKQAGVADTVVMATNLIELPPFPPVVDPPYPGTDDDPAFAFVHVLDYRDTAVYALGDADADDTRPGREAVDRYSTNAGQVAAPLGIRPVAWFDVEATIIGPADRWEEVRINGFPSHATFAALTSDPVWESGSHHRTAGLESTYALQTLPVINELGADGATG